jgi:hypothetical protein
VCIVQYAQYTSNVKRTECTTENTTESHVSIKETFQNVVEKRNQYQSKNRRRRPEETTVSLLNSAYSITYLSRTVKAV